MKRRIFNIFLISIVGLFLFSIHDKAEAENWKVFFKDKDGTHYYDKDSIHFPYNTKGLLGSIKTDKNIVRVWVKSGDWWTILEELRCSQREIELIEYQSLKDLSSIDEKTGLKLTPVPYDPFKERIRIIPGSWEEKLYNEVCK